MSRATSEPRWLRDGCAFPLLLLLFLPFFFLLLHSLLLLLLLLPSSYLFPVVLSCSVMSNSLQPHGLLPARLLCPWGFSWQEYWIGLPCPPPGDLPNPGIEPVSLKSHALAGRLFTTGAAWEALMALYQGLKTELVAWWEL